MVETTKTISYDYRVASIPEEYIKVIGSDLYMLNLSGEALELVLDFIKYSELDTEAMANLMYYDIDGFKRKLKMLEKQVEDIL